MNSVETAPGLSQDQQNISVDESALGEQTQPETSPESNASGSDTSESDSATKEEFSAGTSQSEEPAASTTPTPTASPTPAPTAKPTPVPTAEPTSVPTSAPTSVPTVVSRDGAPAPTTSELTTPTPAPDPLPPKPNVLPVVLLLVGLIALACAAILVLSRRQTDGRSRGTVKMGQGPRRPVSSRQNAPRPSRSGVGETEPMRAPGGKAAPGAANTGAALPRLRVGRAQTIGKRQDQEDSLCYSDWHDAAKLRQFGLLAAVADGIGGMDDGQVASQTAMRQMHALFERLDPAQSASDRLLTLAADAHREVRRLNQSGGKLGTTLVSVLICGWQMWLLSIGDSRIYLYRGGALLLLNRMHVYGKQYEETYALTQTGEKPDARKARALTAYVGQENLRLIDRTVQPIRLLPGDKVLLMSDGVFGTLSEDEILASLGNDPDASAAKIVSAVEAKGKPGQDNASVVIIDVA